MVRALADRGAVRDLIDVHAATRHRTTAGLESLGRRDACFEFSLHDLRDRFAGAEWWDDQDFADVLVVDEATKAGGWLATVLMAGAACSGPQALAIGDHLQLQGWASTGGSGRCTASSTR